MNGPNAVQKLLHRLVMLRPVTAFFASRLHHIDNLVLKSTGGKFTASQLAGWTVIQMTTIGARTGQSRTIPLVGIVDNQKIVLIASSFGRVHNPGWYYNLKAHPKCEVSLNGRSGTYFAREVDGEEYQRYWQTAV